MEVQRCADATLKNAAISAIYRGTDQQKNQTLRACILANRARAQMAEKEAQAALQKAWKEWFATNFFTDY